MYPWYNMSFRINLDPQMHHVRRLVLSIATVLVFLITGCSLFGAEEDPTLTPPLDFSRFSQAPPLLVGRWEWQESTSYGPGEPGRATPSTTGHTETLVFPAPPDSVRVYRSDTLVQHTSRDSFFEGVVEWGVHDDTLATSSAALDGPQKIYKRVD